MRPHAWAGGAGGRADLRAAVGRDGPGHPSSHGGPRRRLPRVGAPTLTCHGQEQKLRRQGTCRIWSCDRRGGRTGPPAVQLPVSPGGSALCYGCEVNGSARGQGAPQGPDSLPRPQYGSHHDGLAEATS